MTEKQPFDWTASDSGPAYAEKIKPGPHYVRIVKLVHSSVNQPDGLRTKKGNDPMFLVICRNAAGEEGTFTLVCTAKSGWMIRKTLSAAGADMQAIQQEGITPSDFAYPDVANSHLLNRCLWVTAEENGEYVNLNPAKEDDVRGEIKSWYGLATDDAVKAKIEEIKASFPAA